MNVETVNHIIIDAIFMMLKIGGPMLLVGLVIGLIVSIFQAATQINEQTLSFIPKVIGIIVTLVFTSSWIFAHFKIFTVNLIQNIPYYIK